MTACSYIGIGIKRIYKIRYETYSIFRRFAEVLKTEIKFLKTPLIDVIKTFCLNKKGLGYELLLKYSDGLLFGYNSISEVTQSLKSIYLTNDDVLEISTFLFALGKSDYESELINLERYLQKFLCLEAQAELALAKKGGMYYKLGVLTGVALMIIVV